MKLQYKAGYLSKNVFNQLRQLMEQEKQKYKILGLFDHVTTFDVITNFNLQKHPELNPLLAVANNLVCRGTPTIASKFISNEVAGFYQDFRPEDFIQALHLIDPRPNRPKYYTDDLDSQFEAAFLNQYFKTSGKVLTQLFQHQRDLTSLTEGIKHGRCDFSFESPYFQIVKKDYVYHKEKRLKQKQLIRIVEIDGAKYHQNILIDDRRDFETAKFGADTNRIKESNPEQDINLLIQSLKSDDYITQINKLTKRNLEEVLNLQNFVLIPLAVARLQKVINQWLISNPQICRQQVVKIAIIERDLPCSKLAIEDLNQLYTNLNGLADHQFVLPKISVDTYSTADYSKFSRDKPAFNPKNLDPKAYDLVIDHAILWRTGIFEADNELKDIDNAVIIRSAHFTEEDCLNSVYSAKPITYRNLTQEVGNENHEEVQDALPFIEYFLQNIFQKDKFRKGQLPILNRALQNKSVIGLLPTGGGKSLTYQLAALLQPGLTIVIDPIRSLMVDQYESLINMGIDKCDFINSILNTQERLFVQNEVLPMAKAQFIFCSPERLVIQEFRDALKLTFANKNYFSYCVIDEAHCVSEWGHDFRTPYLNLGENAINHCKTKTETPLPVFGLTATASFDVLADIERELKLSSDDGNAIIRYENTVRDELNYTILHALVNNDDDDKPKIDNKTVGAKKQFITCSILKDFVEENQNFLKFNAAESIRSVLTKTYHEFLPEFEKEKTTLQEFIDLNLKKILLNDTSQTNFKKNNSGKYNFGILIFCPHTGKLSKKGNRSELGVLTYYDFLRSNCNEKHDFGYFIGAGNEKNKEKYEKESFENLKKFKENEISVMVATKAFGMGIDKDNIRQTIHANIPSSIEAFVQESGRAGRDGKMALATILYNDQLSRDKDELMKFHQNAFKGADKERSMLWELRNGIYEPTSTKLNQINEQINEELDTTLILELGRVKPNGDFTHLLFVKNEANDNIGSINFNNKFYTIKNKDDNQVFYTSCLNRLIGLIPDFKAKSKDEIRAFLLEKIPFPGAGQGIEKLLAEANENEKFELDIPFKNAFYAKSDAGYGEIVDLFAFNNHFDYFCENSSLKSIITNKVIQQNKLEDIFNKAIKNDLTFEKFIQNLPVQQKYQEALLDTVHLKRRYYIPRNVSDTAKAIYRLTSVGIIDNYTIDYLNKTFKIRFSKKSDTTYFKNFRLLIERYTSQEEAKKVIAACKKDYESAENATVISKILEHLTAFIYNKIADKRLRAIDDMVNLCRESILISDPLEQSERIKENIYYYFNAKYTRRGNQASLPDGSFVQADLNLDYENNLSINDTIWKYIEDIIPYDDNQGFINNIKHLRGACMRMLRSRTGAPQFNILKAFALFVLSRNIPDLLIEAQTELVAGIMQWSEIPDSDFQFEKFFERFKDNVEKHIGPKDEDFFGNPDDYFLVTTNLNWLSNFNRKFTKP